MRVSTHVTDIGSSDESRDHIGPTIGLIPHPQLHLYYSFHMMKMRSTQPKQYFDMTESEWHISRP